MENQSKIHSVVISRLLWKIMIFVLLIAGIIFYAVSSSTFFIPLEYRFPVMFSFIGGCLIGAGFGLAYARTFKIEGIDK